MTKSLFYYYYYYYHSCSILTWCRLKLRQVYLPRLILATKQTPDELALGSSLVWSFQSDLWMLPATLFVPATLDKSIHDG
jgi:hypothetical protein